MFKKIPPIAGRKIQVALVGCGRISAKHFEAIDSHADRLQLIAVCDNDEARLQKVVAKYNVKGYADLDDLLVQSKPDMVVLTTPSGLHSEQTCRIARTGTHVMTEKPMATRWQDGIRMVETCDGFGVRLFVVKQNRQNPTLQLLKRAMEQKRFGRIHMVVINVFWSRPQSYYDMDAWRGTWEFDGGALMNQASHYVDLLDWLIGPIESVQSYTGTLDRDIEVEDTATMSVRWRSGAMGSMNVTMLTYPKNLEGSITIIGERGAVRVGGMAVNEIQHWEFDQPHEDDELVNNANYETTSVYGHGHPLYYDNVIRSLMGECEPETDGREGLRSLETLIAAYISARDGRRVPLPLQY